MPKQEQDSIAMIRKAVAVSGNTDRNELFAAVQTALSSELREHEVSLKEIREYIQGWLFFKSLPDASSAYRAGFEDSRKTTRK